MKLFIPFVLSLRMFAITYPALPQATVDTTMPSITGVTRTVNCASGVGDATDLQNKLNAAVGGDAVILPHGCVWTGNFIFPIHSGSGYVVVATDALSALPSPGTRISPSNASSMARLQLPAGTGQVAVLGNDYQNPTYSARASAYWRFSGLEIAAPPAVPMTFSLVTLDAIDDSNNGSAAGLPHHIVFDRVWVHADTLTTVMSRAFRANAAYFAVVDSYINQIQAPSAPFPNAGEAQTICAWNSPGPFMIVNNYLEASTENTMFGGNFGFQGVGAFWTASDITFQHNYVAKNAAWAPGGATVWDTKNLFELKEGVRVLVTDNVFEYSWQGGQNGFAMSITPRTQQSGLWTNISDVVVSSNVIRHVGGFLSALAQDDACTSLNQSSVVNISGSAVTWVSGATFGSTPGYTGAAFTVNGSGSYVFTWTSSTTGTLNTNLGTVNGATLVLICNSQDRALYANNLIDDVNESYGTPAATIKPSGFNDLAIRNNSTIRSDSSSRPSFYFQNLGCYSGAQDIGNNLLIRYNLLFNTVNADCLIDPSAIFPLATGTVNVDHNLLVNLSSVDQTRWTTWDAATQFSASVASLELTPDHTAFANGSPFDGQGLGPNLSCFNETAVIAGTPSALCPLPAEVTPAVDLLTANYDLARDSWNASETTLTPAAVAAANGFGKLGFYPLDDLAYSHPLYVSQYSTVAGTKNMIVVATMNGTLYAYDADALGSAALIWSIQFNAPLDSALTPGSPTHGSSQLLAYHVGCASTPVIDKANGVVYAVCSDGTSGSTTTGWAIHRVNLGTGVELGGSPVTITATFLGPGDQFSSPVDTQTGGSFRFNGHYELQRVPLALDNGNLYVAFTAYADMRPGHGEILEYTASTLTLTNTWCVTPDPTSAAGALGGLGSLWQSGRGIAIDASHNLYVMTGNGDYGAVSTFFNYSDAFVKLTASLAESDFYTPSNNSTLNTGDWDVSSDGPILVGGQILGGSKDYIVRNINSASMGGFGGSIGTQTLSGTPTIISGVYDQSYANGILYESTVSGPIYGLPFSGTTLSASTIQTTGSFAFPGAFTSVSSNGASTGIVWAQTCIGATGFQVNNQFQHIQHGTLRAFDASTLAEIYNSDAAGSRDDLASCAKFEPPVVANGKVYVVNSAGQLVVYGLGTFAAGTTDFGLL